MAAAVQQDSILFTFDVRSLKMTDQAFYEFCQRNKDFRFEMNRKNRRANGRGNFTVKGFLTLLLFLVATSSVVFAQTEEGLKQAETPSASQTDEFGIVPNGYIRASLDAFFVELTTNPSVQGYIINYGTNRQGVKREKAFRSRLNYRRFNASRITFVRGSNKKEFLTEFWIVPEGAEPPIPQK